MTDLLDILQTNADGTSCITEAWLDKIWPRDDSEPVLLVGKGINLPPTCTTFVPCEERFGYDYCIKAVFNGSTVTTPAAVPLPETGVMLGAALMLILIAKWVTA